jgi:hypothetical protein
MPIKRDRYKSILKALVKNLENTMLFPWHLIKGMATRDFKSDGMHFISLSPEINSINDHTFFSHKPSSFKRYGFWGYSPRHALGINFGAAYAFLPNYLLWKTGVCGYTLFSILCYIALFYVLAASLSLTPIWSIILVCAFALYSPYFKNSAFVAGRYDVPGWALMIIGIIFLSTGKWFLSFVLLSLAFMTHPSISIACSVYMVAFIFIGKYSANEVIVFLGAQFANLFWYIPFFRVFIQRDKFHNKVYAPDQNKAKTWQWQISSKDATRSGGVYALKTVGMLAFLIPSILISSSFYAKLFVLVPFLFFLLSIRKEMFLNRFSIELLWLSSAPVTLVLHDSISNQTAFLLAIAYLFSIFFYASPSPRLAFPFRPFVIRNGLIRKVFSPIAEALHDGIRVGFVNFPDSTEDWRLNTKYSCLFSEWLIDQEKKIERVTIGLQPFGGDIVVQRRDNITEELNDISKQYGISFFLVPIANKHIFDGLDYLSFVTTCNLPDIGSVPGTTFVLYKNNIKVSKIHPEGEIMENSDGTLTVQCNAGKHEMKYRTITGLRAFQNSCELPIEAGSDCNFFINPLKGGDILITYDSKRLWLPNHGGTGSSSVKKIG